MDDHVGKKSISFGYKELRYVINDINGIFLGREAASGNKTVIYIS